MRKILILISIFILIITSVTALSPTLEQECCAILDSDQNYGDYLEESCAELNLNATDCEQILIGWKSAQDRFARSTRPEYACCTYLGRDDEALKYFDEDFVFGECREYNLNRDICGVILYSSNYPREEYELIAKKWEDKSLNDSPEPGRIPGIIILAFLAFAAYLIWCRFINTPSKMKK